MNVQRFQFHEKRKMRIARPIVAKALEYLIEAVRPQFDTGSNDAGSLQ